MAEKTVRELAAQVGRPVEQLLEQLVAAGLPARGATDKVSLTEQEELVAYLKRAHGESGAKKITLQRKTLQTAQVATSTGRAKTIHVEVKKKQTFIKPDLAALAKAAKEKEQAVQSPTLDHKEDPAAVSPPQEAQISATENQTSSNAPVVDTNVDRAAATTVVEVAKSDNISQAQKLAEAAKAKVQHKAEHTTKSGVSSAAEEKAKEAKKEVKKRPVKEESTEERQKREAEEARLKAEADAARKAAQAAAEERIREQMRQMATKYSSKTEIVDDDDVPLADGLVGKALEESFEKEDRDIKRGGANATTRLGKGASRHRREGEEREIKHTFKHKTGGNKHAFTKPVEKQTYTVDIGESVMVADLAQKMAVKVKEVIKTLMKMGEMVNQNQRIDQATAALVVEEMGHEYVLVSETQAEDNLLADASKNRGEMLARPPVVTIMGHVDHGKTSLLDYIRKAKVAAGEAGGITQHIGAYHVTTDKGVITFLDTPGHAAFSKMRERGSKATDIVILIVAADDGVMPQTIESIKHAQAANTPIIVAINKVDKESADVDRVLSELAQYGITTELWGGDTPAAKVSAKTGQGIDELLDLITIQAELMELRAPLEGAAQGVVIEAKVEKGRGAVVSLLVQKGTLKVGDLVLVGQEYGKVRAMFDELGQQIKSATPSIPVEILGLPDTPNAGDEFLVVADEKKAREVATFRAEKDRHEKLERANNRRLENLFANMGKKEVPTVNVVLKTDVKGSLEALTSALYDLSVDDVSVRIVGSGVGAISESDVILAVQSDAVLLGFNVRADNPAKIKATEEEIDIRYYSVLYEMIDDVKAAMSGLLAPEHREKILGVAQVRQVFRSSRFGAAAGCMVQEGSLFRNKPIRVLRDGVVVFQGELESLRRHKDDVNEVKAGIECGLAVKGYNDIQEGDQVEVYEVHEIRRTL